MFNYTIKASGPLFEGKVTTKKIIEAALKETADFAKNTVKNVTPVKSGALKSGWLTTVNRKSVTLSNSVIYAPYVEKKVQMVNRSLPVINENLQQNIAKGINKLK
ncbi:HK97 gp10 family phage protein [Nostoc sp. 'Peltigera membranacea cyanobiont' N6]|uniref:HK97 gp10 family phage protein n=1 Tax=Nostoc sp. 'Peltigera membranacea cyanobiont' N6 TaxID=1261031 RepID=UPI000CF35BC6|nr:HK97 gp10 family phage protein [Nostoc sp. 'Peltigera membranacea cyanobiont' N6]AVH67037.1 HK97-gp10 family phage tail protein [Nostoc sp. 'Peltigera membranacea cyanobiont' N6]